MIESKSIANPPATPDLRTDPPDIYPAGSQFRLCSVAMALHGAIKLFSEITDGSDDCAGVAGILDLAVAELTRINSEMEASRGN